MAVGPAERFRKLPGARLDSEERVEGGSQEGRD